MPWYLLIPLILAIWLIVGLVVGLIVGPILRDCERLHLREEEVRKLERKVAR